MRRDGVGRRAIVVGVVCGISFAVGLGATMALVGGDLVVTLVVALAGGVIVGDVAALVAMREPARSALGTTPSAPYRSLSTQDRRAARRAARRGAVPARPEVRAAAHDFAEELRQQTARQRGWTTTTFAGLAGLMGALAIVGPSTYAVAAVLFAIAAAAQLWAPRYYARRTELLTDAGSPTS